MNKKKVLIVGGGFGGLAAAKKLKNASDLEVIVIDSTNHHLFQPLLYQVACAALHPADIAAPLREILKKSTNTTVILSKVTHIQKENRSVQLESGEVIYYDYLILAVGARHSYFGNDEWEVLAPGLKNIGDALEIRKRMLLAYERLEIKKFFHHTSRELQLNFVIIGAGPTGVELAGAISDIAQHVLKKNFRYIHPEQTKIYVIERGPRILSQFPVELSERAKKDLESMGVTVMTNSTLKKIDKNGVYINDQFIPTTEIFWAAGNHANPLLATLNTPLDKSGRAFVNKDLTLPEYPELFIIGDAACALDPKGIPFPELASVATQQGHYVAHLIRKNIHRTKRKAFTYKDRGVLATIGRKRAVGIVFGWKIKGLFAWLTWNFVHLAYIIGFGNKLMIINEWAYNYLTNNRVSRLIYNQFKTP